MKLEYTLTLRDYKAALKLHRKQKLIRRLSPYIGPLLLLLSIIGFIFASLAHRPEIVADSAALGAGSLTVTALLPISNFFNIRRCFKGLFPPSRTDRTSNLDIDNERIVSSIPGVSEGKILWPGVYKFAQDDKVTMIYLAERRFLFFPTPAMSPAQRTELNDLIARHVTKR
ncbi:MAG TPA: YcxB family protein [Terracidiphilus sp.]|nr:YcxB family protein [Terracidiphilus sp.]